MEYSVGSLADLITGKNTPNKPKVIQKELIVGRNSLTNSGKKIKSPKIVEENGLDVTLKKKRKSSLNFANDIVEYSQKTPKKGKSFDGFQIKGATGNSATKLEKSVSEGTPSKKKNKKSGAFNDINMVVHNSEKKKLKKLKKNKFKVENTLENGDADIDNIVLNGSDSIISSENAEEITQSTKKNKKPKMKNEVLNNEANIIVHSSEKKKSKKLKKKKDTVQNGHTEMDKGEPENKKGIKRKFESNEDVGSPKKSKLSKSEKNAAKRVLYKERELTKENPEDQERTLFIGNIPIGKNLDHTKKKIKQHFRKYGIIESVRFRGIPVADPKTPKKVAAIKSELNPNRKTVLGYIKFVNKEDAEKATEENGCVFDDHHLRVHITSSEEKPDESKAIFIGNLSFDAIEDDLWKLFESCGTIDNIRIVRDNRTGMGRGFGYINFTNSDSVQLALEMENVKLKNRELRISLCNLNMAKKNKKKNKVAAINKHGKPKTNRSRNFNKDAGNDRGKPRFENKSYQGSKFTDKNKKKKINRGELQKKRLVKKIAPKAD